VGGQPKRITVSIGVAAMAPNRDTRQTLMAAADVALYRAKSEGRNRVCVDAASLSASPHAQAIADLARSF
jgi:diguanylate cyclase (GGDEF)-like protein